MGAPAGTMNEVLTELTLRASAVEEQALSSAAGLEEMRQELAALYGVPPASILLSLEGGGLAVSQADTAAPPEKFGWEPERDAPVDEPPPLVIKLAVIEPEDAEASAELERRVAMTGDDQISKALHAKATHTAPQLLHIIPGGQPVVAGDGRESHLNTSAGEPAAPGQPVDANDGFGSGWLVLLAVAVLLGMCAAAHHGHRLPSIRSLPSLPRSLPSVRFIAGLPSLLRGSRLARHMQFKDSGSRPRAAVSSRARGASVACGSSAAGTGAGPRDFKVEAEKMRAKLREKEAADQKMKSLAMEQQREEQLTRTQQPKASRGGISSTPSPWPMPERFPPSSWQSQREGADVSRALYDAACGGGSIGAPPACGHTIPSRTAPPSPQIGATPAYGYPPRGRAATLSACDNASPFSKRLFGL